MEALQEACELALEAGEASSSSNPNPTLEIDKKKRKRTLNEIIADIPDPPTVLFDPLCIPSKHPLILYIPPDLDTDDPYALFILFWPEKIWQTITVNTNLYAVK
jgi:hypothetical protein